MPNLTGRLNRLSRIVLGKYKLKKINELFFDGCTECGLEGSEDFDLDLRQLQQIVNKYDRLAWRLEDEVRASINENSP